MGNHEFNAIAWHTPDPDLPGEYLRQHSGSWGESNRKQHAAFLDEVDGNPTLHQEVIDWFMTLPLWLDSPGIRVVHACWHDGYMSQLKRHLTPANQLTPELLVCFIADWHMCPRSFKPDFHRESIGKTLQRQGNTFLDGVGGIRNIFGDILDDQRIRTVFASKSRLKTKLTSRR